MFHFSPEVSQYKSEQEAILMYIGKNKAVNAQQIADYLGVSRNSALRKIKDLITQNKIEKFGKGPSVKYSLKV